MAPKPNTISQKQDVDQELEIDFGDKPKQELKFNFIDKIKQKNMASNA